MSDVAKGKEEKSLLNHKNPNGIIAEQQIIPFKERLKDVIGDESIREFSRRCELSDKTIRDYLRGKSYPTLDRLSLIANASDKSFVWLATGVDVNEQSQTLPVATEDRGLVKVPQYDLQASAGCGCMVISENPVAEFSFSQEWIDSQGLSGAALTVVPVHGDSMEPTLSDGDLMLVKIINEPSEARDGLCIIRIDDNIFVKRIQYDYLEGTYLIASDNPQYKNFTIDQQYQDRFSVVGRVIRVLQRAKSWA
ncbi:XRE family transcriptional regulator [Photobacterium damselae]|uniref:XRE family transcriptional regulator n=1 Tax=Photobacterium damselae TaxID=38293 RepID=UPI0035A979DC